MNLDEKLLVTNFFAFPLTFVISRLYSPYTIGTCLYVKQRYRVCWIQNPLGPEVPGVSSQYINHVCGPGPGRNVLIIDWLVYYS